MSKYLLDTNVISELRKPKPHGAVVAWVGGLDASQIFLAAATLGELQVGIERTRKQDPDKAREIEAWVDGLAASVRVLPMDGACFREWARLMHGKPDDLFEDGMIAATARIHDLTVATRNTRDFHRLGVQVVDPFRPPPSRDRKLEEGQHMGDSEGILIQKHCVPCKGDVPPLRGEALEKLSAQIPDWKAIAGHHLAKTFVFPDFKAALAFVNRVGTVAEAEGHHPDLMLTWGRVDVKTYTHKIDGLTENDFILAAKIDQEFLRK